MGSESNGWIKEVKNPRCHVDASQHHRFLGLQPGVHRPFPGNHGLGGDITGMDILHQSVFYDPVQTGHKQSPKFSRIEAFYNTA